MLHFFIKKYKGVILMNYFFDFLLPQLIEYFNNDINIVKDFLPNFIIDKYSNLLLSDNKNNDNIKSDKDIEKAPIFK